MFCESLNNKYMLLMHDPSSVFLGFQNNLQKVNLLKFRKKFIMQFASYTDLVSTTI